MVIVWFKDDVGIFCVWDDDSDGNFVILDMVLWGVYFLVLFLFIIIMLLFIILV